MGNRLSLPERLSSSWRDFLSQYTHLIYKWMADRSTRSNVCLEDMSKLLDSLVILQHTNILKCNSHQGNKVATSNHKKSLGLHYHITYRGHFYLTDKFQNLWISGTFFLERCVLFGGLKCTSSIGKSTFGTPKLVHYSEVISIVSFIQSEVRLLL